MLESSAPIFIVGMPRSGTTLTSMILNAHSQISISPETHYFDKYFPNCQRDGCLSYEDRARRFVDRFLHGPEVAQMGFDEPELSDLASEILSRPERSHRTVLDTVLGAYARKYGKPHWGEKTPGHIMYVPLIAELFPMARFICVVRDPRDVSLSLRKVPWSSTGAVGHAVRWRRFSRRSAQYRATYDQRYVELRYEDLLGDTESAVQAICDFLRVDYEPQMLAYHEHAQLNFDVAKEPWKRKSAQALDPGNAMKWKRQMSRAEIKVIESVARDEMERHGYEVSDEAWRPSLVVQAARMVLRDASRWSVKRLRCTMLS